MFVLFIKSLFKWSELLEELMYKNHLYTIIARKSEGKKIETYKM